MSVTIICPKCYSELEADEAFRLGERVTCPACNHTWAHVPSQAHALKSALEKREKHKRQLAAELKKRDKQAKEKAAAEESAKQTQASPPASTTPGGDALVALFQLAQAFIVLGGFLWFLSAVNSCESETAAEREQRQAERRERTEEREKQLDEQRASCKLEVVKGTRGMHQGRYVYMLWLRNDGAETYSGHVWFYIKNPAGDVVVRDYIDSVLEPNKYTRAILQGRPGGSYVEWHAEWRGATIKDGVHVF